MSSKNLVYTFTRKRLSNIYGLLTIVSTHMDEMVKIATNIISIREQPECMQFKRDCNFALALLNDDLKGHIGSPPHFLKSMNRLGEDECMFKMSEWFHELETELSILHKRNYEEQVLVFDEIEEIEFEKKPSRLEKFVKEDFFTSVIFWKNFFDGTKHVILDRKKKKGTSTTPSSCYCTCF